MARPGLEPGTPRLSRAAVASETGLFAGNSLDSGHVYGVRVFPDFAPVSPALRQTARVVCLFVVAMAILTTGRGGATRRLPWRSATRSPFSCVIADRGY
jgi:hypothetical protein